MIREFHQTSLRGRNSFGVEQHAARLVEFETEEDLHAIFGGGIPDRWSVLSGGNNILFTQDYDGLLLTPVSQRIALLGEEGARYTCAPTPGSNGTTWWSGPYSADCGGSKTSR